jgi:hypothetical protein
MNDSITGALIECIKACGGSKQVGPKLWPEKTPDAAQRLLLDCLNDDRPARLTPEQLLLVLRMARDRGCHAGMQFIASALSYSEPVPIQPKDEADELRRQVLEMGRTLQTALARIEQLDRPALRAAA